MELVKKEVELPKESVEAMELVLSLVKGIKAKKDVTALVAENLQPLMLAIQGAEQIPAELKDNKMAIKLAGFYVGELASELL